MKELMAFVVLSLPILAVLLILVLAVLAARAAMRQKKVPEKKWKAGILAALAVILVFTWDEIVGRLYFHYLCAAEGGAKVYKKVKLPPEYWNPDGRPIFLDTRGNRIRSKLDDNYDVFKRTGEQQISQLFRIKKYGYTVSDRSTNEILGIYTFVFFYGGWVENTFSMNVKGIHCPDDNDVEAHLLSAIFVNSQERESGR